MQRDRATRPGHVDGEDAVRVEEASFPSSRGLRGLRLLLKPRAQELFQFVA